MSSKSNSVGHPTAISSPFTSGKQARHQGPVPSISLGVFELTDSSDDGAGPSKDVCNTGKQPRHQGPLPSISLGVFELTDSSDDGVARPSNDVRSTRQGKKSRSLI